MAEETGAAIPAVPVQDSLRRIPTQRGHYPVDRGFYRAVQTPQCFDAEMFYQAITKSASTEWLDDATMYEAAGFGVTLVSGESTNLKITTAFDLQIAEALLGSK
jgi:2-C-methyl-D-erythritol 4-phosphate cytidylyltransferase